ncbi:MAG: tail fiber protein [Brevundimonas sp.]|uniref:phage tail protein n=1 Tax=Brevundimonas sp. TaxID=1871086 RepID=UPI003002C49B
MTKTGKLAALVAGVALAGSFASSATAQDNFVGELQQFATNWCPDGWHRADGSLMAIAQYEVLFSLIGTTYGGNGIQTFGLPDLRTRMPVGYDNQLPIGAMTGTSSTTLLQFNLPSHSHNLQGDETGPVSNSPAGAMLGTFPASSPIYSSGAGAFPLNIRVVELAGGNQPVQIQSPILATNWCIALYGIYPSRPD